MQGERKKDVCVRPCVHESLRACVEACVHLNVCLRSWLEDLNNSTSKNKNKTFLAPCVHILDIPKTLSENKASGEKCYASLNVKHFDRKLTIWWHFEICFFYFGPPCICSR